MHFILNRDGFNYSMHLGLRYKGISSGCTEVPIILQDCLVNSLQYWGRNLVNDQTTFVIIALSFPLQCQYMFKVYSFQIADSIDIRNFKAAFTAEIYFSDNDELFYYTGTDKFIYVFKYGVVCFLNYSEVDMTGFLELIKPFGKNLLKERLSEEFEIEVNASKIYLGFNKVSIPENDTEMLRLIMMHVSQSVALDHFEILTNKLLEETNSHTQTLEVKGKLDMSGLSLKKYIGKTLNLKNRIAENLYIFDSPEETWEHENLNKLDIGLKKTFDLQSRFRTIEEGLAIVKENLELFKDLLQYRHSMTLEWVIIALIAVEVLNLIFEKLIGK